MTPMQPIEKQTIDDLTLVFAFNKELDQLGGPPPCEGTTHPSGEYGHTPQAPASYRVHLGCGHAWNACATWVAAMVLYEGVLCPVCGQTSGEPNVWPI